MTTSRTATPVATAAISSDSPRYWATSDTREAPITFLIPASFILSAAFAVDKFMKLIHAMNNINTAMIVNSRTYSILPPEGTPLS